MKYRTLTKYVIRRHVAPFALAFVVLLILFVLDQLLHIVDAVLESGLPFLTVIAFFGYSFSWMAALAVPMAVLISVLMVFTRMSESNEIVAMKAAGIGPLRVMGGPILVGAALSLVMVWFNNEVIPDAVHRARLILTAIHRARPAITLKGREGMFIDDFPGYRLRVDRVRLDAPSPMAPYEGSRVDGVVLYELDPAGRRSPSIVTAKWGTVEIWGEGEEMRLILHQGELHRADPEDQSRYLRTSFEKQVIYVTDPKRKSDKKRVKRQSDWRNDRELSSAAMRKRVEGHEEHIRQARERIAKLNENTELGDRQKKREREHQERLIKRKQRIINAYLVEIHKKYSI
ncbi:MAG: LptF/LptG family permease, partial [Candidatus Latescibacteria bacterium]|nr:LptF/LptG family permease [Candidatus Latescibacterota bacterium]